MDFLEKTIKYCEANKTTVVIIILVVIILILLILQKWNYGHWFGNSKTFNELKEKKKKPKEEPVPEEVPEESPEEVITTRKNPPRKTQMTMEEDQGRARSFDSQSGQTLPVKEQDSPKEDEMIIQ